MQSHRIPNHSPLHDTDPVTAAVAELIVDASALAAQLPGGREECDA